MIGQQRVNVLDRAYSSVTLSVYLSFTFTYPLTAFFSVLHCPLGLVELQACPCPTVAFTHLPLCALSSSLFHCAFQDGFGQT